MRHEPRMLRASTSYQLGNLVVSNLSKKQATTLLLCAEGMSEKEAAKAMNCSRNNITQLKNRLFIKFSVSNTSKLIVTAFEKKSLQFVSAYVALQNDAPQTIELPEKGNH